MNRLSSYSGNVINLPTLTTSLVSLLFLSASASVAQAQPPTRTPVEVVEAMFEAFNRHDAVAMSALYADDAVLTSSDFCAPRGKRDIERTYGDLFQALPDIQDDVQLMIASGDRVAVQFTARSDSPRPMSFPLITILTVRDGLIVSDDTVFDTHNAPCSP